MIDFNAQPGDIEEENHPLDNIEAKLAFFAGSVSASFVTLAIFFTICSLVIHALAGPWNLVALLTGLPKLPLRISFILAVCLCVGVGFLYVSGFTFKRERRYDRRENGRFGFELRTTIAAFVTSGILLLEGALTLYVRLHFVVSLLVTVAAIYLTFFYVLSDQENIERLEKRFSFVFDKCVEGYLVFVMIPLMSVREAVY